MITVEVIHIDERRTVFYKTLSIQPGTPALELVKQSGFFEEYPEYNGNELSLGLFSKPILNDTPINEDTRLEIYRALTLSPMERRRLVAAKQKRNKSG